MIAKNCCWIVVRSLGVYALKGAEEGIPFCWEGDAGLEPYGLYLFLNLVYQSIKLLGSFLYVGVYCMICISVFDLLLILNHL